MSTYTDASLIVTPNSKKAGKLYSLKPTDGTGDLNVVRATTATYVGSDGLIKTALANEVRFDYTNGSCPSILVEPQRTNLLLRSEEFDNVWDKFNISVVSNSTTSPSGTMTADTITINVINNSRINQEISVTENTNYTFSFYVLRGTATDLRYSVFNRSASSILIAPTSYYSQTSASSWVRVSVAFTTPVGCTRIIIYPVRDVGSTGTVFLWGAQLEAGANATSYIPTVASTVTRNADVISKTGISSLIGQTEGTIFADFNITNNDLSSNKTIISLDDNSYYVNIIAARILNTNILNIIFRAGSVGITFSNMPIISNGNHKIAIRYGNGFASIFVDGILINTQVWTSSFTNPISQLFVGKNRLETPYLNDTINSLAHWKTALTDEQCISLTTL